MSLVVLASLFPPDVEVRVIDEYVEPIDFSEFFDLVLVTFFTLGATRAYEIGDAFRKEGVKVVFGGVHASMLPEEAIQKLPTKLKSVFLLHDVQGFKHKEIAQILGCTIGTSKSQLFKARMKIRQKLEKKRIR